MKKPIFVNGVELATIIDHENGQRDVLWKVYGPQDMVQATELCRAVLDACAELGVVPVGGPAPAPSDTPSAKPTAKPSRNYTKAIREELAKGLSDDEVFAALADEFALTPDKKYRIKEVRAEEAKKTNASPPISPDPVPTESEGGVE